MKICLTVDKNYERMTRACVYDIITHASKQEDIVFYLLYTELDDASAFKKFEKLPNVTVYLIQVNPLSYFVNIKNFTNLRYLTSTMYLRCLLPKYTIVAEQDRILYTDPDIFVLKDICEMYNEPLNDNIAGAIKDFGILNVWGDKNINPKDYKHFCSGGMVLDIPKLREFEFTEKCIAKITGDRSDQPVINEVLEDHVQYLSPKYMFSYHKILQGVKEYGDIKLWNRAYGTNYKSIDELKKEAVIIHCHGDKNQQMKHPVLKDMYEKRSYVAEEFLKK